MFVPIWSGPFSIKRNTFLWKIGTKCSFRAKKNVLFRIFNIERNFLFLNEWLRNNGIVPLLSFWSFLFTKGTIVPINAIPFRVALPFMLARGTLVPNYLRSFSCKGTFVPFYHCSCFENWFLLFIEGTIVSINGSGLNEMEQFVPNHKFLFM